LVTIFLIRPQRGLEQAGQFRLDRLRLAQAVDGLAEVGRGVQLGAFEHLVEPGGGDRRCLAAVLVGFENGRQIAQLLLQRTGQRGIDTVTHRHEARLVARCGEQGGELQHQPFIERCLPGDAEPVTLATDPDAELPRVDGDDAHALALGPFDRGNRGQRRQLLDDTERFFRILDQPFGGALAVVEEGQGVEDCFEMPALGGEVALGADRLAADHAHQAGPAAARRQARSVGAERRHHQAQRKLVTHRRELGVQARVARHLPGGLRRVGVHLEAGGERAQGLLDFLLGAGGVRRNGKATGNEVGRLLLLGREAHQPQALRAVLNERDQAQCFGFTAGVGVDDVVDVVVDGRPQRWLDAHHEVVALPDQLEFGSAFGEVDELLGRIRQDDARMPDEGHDRR
jgi:hypothetical protein